MLNSPRALALLTVLLWSFGAVSAKFISSSSEFLLFAISTLSTYVTFQVIQFIKHRKLILVSWSDIWSRRGAISVFGYGIYWICYAQAYRNSPNVVLPAALNYTWPPFTALFSELFFRSSQTPPFERLIGWLGLLIGFSGVLLVISNGDFQALAQAPWAAILWGLAAGASYGFFSAGSSSVPSGEQLNFLVLASVTGSALLAPLGLYEKLSSPPPSWNLIGITISLGILLEGIGYYTWTKANRLALEQNLNVTAITSIVYALPFLGALVVSIAYKELDRLTPIFGVGLLLLVMSAVICQRASVLAKWLHPPSHQSITD